MESIKEDLLINFDQSSTTAGNLNDIQTRTGILLSYDTFIFIFLRACIFYLYLISSSIGLNRRLDNCSLMSKHERRKDEGGKDAQRKNEQHTSMSKQQMSRNKRTRQEDDNKSKEGFDDIATGNPSINNSTLLTSYSRENSSSDTCMYLKDLVLLVGITKNFLLFLHVYYI